MNFFTNGLLLNDRNIETILQSGLTQLCISVDGATPETYNSIRRDGDFDHLIDNVKRFIARRSARHQTTPRVRFDYVLMKRNIRELPDLVKLAAELGVEQLSFRHLVSFEGLNMEQESLQNDKALSNYCLNAAVEEAVRLGLEVQTKPAPFEEARQPLEPPPQKQPLVRIEPIVRRISERLFPKRQPVEAVERTELPVPFLPTPYCPFPFFHIAMGPGGHVHPCPHSHGEAPYGQVSQQTPLHEIWLNAKFMNLRNRILQHDPPEMCRRCPYLADTYPNVAELFATRNQAPPAVHALAT